MHGLFTSDPRHVNNTRLIREVSYRVAQELASMGAKVLHPRCLIPAAWAGIPVEVHNTIVPNETLATEYLESCVSKYGEKVTVKFSTECVPAQMILWYLDGKHAFEMVTKWWKSFDMLVLEMHFPSLNMQHFFHHGCLPLLPRQ